MEENTRSLPPSQAARIPHTKKPDWLKCRAPGGESYVRIKTLLRSWKLHTVCEEAHCPNISECWQSGTATFILGGDTCTRACRFCAVKTARKPPPLDTAEPLHIAESITQLHLKYVVLTSVNRDDLPDGGAAHFARTISEIKKQDQSVLVEALVPDFQGNPEAVRTVVESGVDVYAHNIETIKRLQSRVRDPRAGYERSLNTLILAKSRTKNHRKIFTKTSIMLGLGETEDELEKTWDDLREYQIDILTIGQYLRPSLQHLPVERYYSPEEFKALGNNARKRGFIFVASGPMVRSSYRAAEVIKNGL